MVPFLLVFGVMFSVAGVASMVRASRLRRTHEQASAWPQVPGVVVQSRLVTEGSGEELVHRVEISCEFAVRGQRLVTSKHTEGLDLDDLGGVERILATDYPRGKAVLISVDPSDPERAVLITGFPPSAVPLQNLGRLFVGLGIACLFLGLWHALHGGVFIIHHTREPTPWASSAPSSSG